RYLALSYVWGGPQGFQNVQATQKALQKPGSLSTSHPLPQTIRDAMDFASAVGEQYLWIDSLCIVQNDEDGKMLQVNAMDQIYSQALVTIMA
ncbi:heterokaryon incompatibility, partial [Lophiotrema nucula]